MYLISLIACFIMALGNKPKRSRLLYLGMVVYWAIVMAYLIFASIFMTVRSIQAEKRAGFHVRDLFQNSVFSTLIVSMASTYALWFIISFLSFDPAHMFTSFVQYLLMTPTYINMLNVFAFCNTDDLTWGTKEGKAKTPRSAVDVDENNKVKIRVEPPDVEYSKELELLAAPRDGPAKPPSDEDTKREAEEEKKAYYASVRSGIVMAWIFTNLGLCTVVLQTGSIQVFDKSGEDPTQKKLDTAKIYLSVVLWSVAGLSLFRFVGSCWFLLRRKVS
jgi:chitin synthase